MPENAQAAASYIMGKSKKGGNSRRGDDDDWEQPEGSVASLDGGGTELERPDEFQEALDWTFESRGSTRERGWERLAALLRSTVREEVRRRCN